MISVPVVRFAKYHGLGNDFILVDARAAEGWVPLSEARRLCDRRRGVGADGVITLLPSRDPAADLRMHIINSDGSVPEMCGNGLRCLVRFVCERDGRAPRKLAIDTDAGLREGEILAGGRVRVTLGRARMLEADVDATVGSDKRSGMAVSVGNPHLVLRPTPGQDLRTDAQRLGPVLEHHPRFPDRTNVGFFEPLSRTAIRLVVFERGAGLTEACGTGAGAATFAAKRWDLVDQKRPIEVELLGGRLEVTVEGDAVAIAGEAVHVFDGEVEVPVLQAVQAASR